LLATTRKELSVTRVARKREGIDAELGDRAPPFVVIRAVEEQRVVRRHGEPAIRLDLGIELAWAPAGVAEGEEALARTFAATDRAQDVHRRGKADIAHHQRRLLGVIGRMQHEAARRLDRAADMHLRAVEAAPLDAELLQKLAHRR